jgi:hypothetical protein
VPLSGTPPRRGLDVRINELSLSGEARKVKERDDRADRDATYREGLDFTPPTENAGEPPEILAALGGAQEGIFGNLQRFGRSYKLL